MAVARLSGQDCNATSATTSVTATYPGATTAGNLLVAFVMSNVPGVPAMSGWTLAASEPINTGVVGQLAVFYKISTGDTTAPATATLATVMQIQAYEYSGAANPAVVDAVTESNSGASTVTSQGTGNITTTIADDLIVMACACAAAVSATSWSVGTMLQANVTNRLIGGQRIPAAILSGSGDAAAWTTARQACAIIVAFVPAETPKSGTETGNWSDAGESLAVAASDTFLVPAFGGELGSSAEATTVAAALSDTDSAAGFDAGERVGVFDADAGSGVDDGESIVVQITDSDTASATDNGETVGLADSDSGSGTDAGETLADTLTDADAGTGTDLEALAAAFTDADTGTGTDDGETLATALSDPETASGADAGESVAAGFSDSDAGSGADGGEAVAVAHADDDSATALDAGESVAQASTDAEVGTAVESEALANAATDGDSATALEVESLTVSMIDGDTAVGTELEAIAVVITDTETGSTTEVGVVTIVGTGGWLVGAVSTG